MNFKTLLKEKWLFITGMKHLYLGTKFHPALISTHLTVRSPMWTSQFIHHLVNCSLCCLGVTGNTQMPLVEGWTTFLRFPKSKKSRREQWRRWSCAVERLSSELGPRLQRVAWGRLVALATDLWGLEPASRLGDRKHLSGQAEGDSAAWGSLLALRPVPSPQA